MRFWQSKKREEVSGPWWKIRFFGVFCMRTGWNQTLYTKRDAQLYWPTQGPTYLERLRVRALYKRVLRQSQKEQNQSSWNNLHTTLESCDTNDFWRSWKTLYSQKSNGFSPVVDGCTSKPAIAESFRKAFKRNSEPNNQSKVDDLNAAFKTQYAEYNTTHDQSCNCRQ